LTTREGGADTEAALVVSYFARNSSCKHRRGYSFVSYNSSCKRRQEIEAAIYANTRSALFAEVVVVFDSVTSRENCSHLIGRLDRWRHSEPAQPEVRAQLTCVDRRAAQPSYSEMFQYANWLPLRSNAQVVVLANADCVVVGDSALLSSIPRRKVFVLSIASPSGWLSTSPLMKDALAVYKRQVGVPRCGTTPRCNVKSNNTLRSWDGYLFRRPLRPPHRYTLPPDIFMNAVGAENRAGLALIAANATDRMYSLCGRLELVDFHCSAKTHWRGDTVGELSDVGAISLASWQSDFPGRGLPRDFYHRRGDSSLCSVHAASPNATTAVLAAHLRERTDWQETRAVHPQ